MAKNKNNYKVSLKLKLKTFLSKYSHFFWVLFFSLVILFISHHLVLKRYTLFGYKYLWEIVEIIIVFVILYFYGLIVYRFIAKWLEKIIENTFSKILRNFWKGQTDKLVEAIKKENLSIENNGFKCKSVVLDTSAIIDGRIFDVIKTGFLDNPIIVTQNVIDELQYLADNGEKNKRKKGRAGLDSLREIKKKVGDYRFKIVDLKTSPEKVDKSLVHYCKVNKCKIATVDYNLNKTADVAGVEVLNVNKLANEIKTKVLPGDTIVIKFIQEGTEKNQVVGYLDDGTMVVVNDAKDLLNKKQAVVVDKVLQTNAGRMIFAKIKNSQKSTEKRNKKMLFYPQTWRK